MKKFLLKNSETGFQKAETRFQNAETRFQNAKTALSRIFFARTWMDSAQKKPEYILFVFFSRLSGSGQLLFVRLMSGSELEPRHGRTRAGWISRTGSKPGLPNVHVEKMRRVGVDKNLQVSLQQA